LIVFVIFIFLVVASTSFVSASNVTAIHSPNSTVTNAKLALDTTPPVTKSSNPGKNALNVPINQNIKITYSEPVKFHTGWIELKNDQEKLTPIITTINGSILTIAPNKSLNMGTSYTVIVHTNSITDMSGNNIAVNAFRFTTAIKIDIIDTKTGGDISKNSLLYSYISKTVLSKQILSKAKSGTPMVTFGDGNGPKVLIVAGVHGNELPATTAAMKLINYLNGKTIHGTIYIIPFAIPYNTANIQRYWNGQNPNSIANIDGTPTNIIMKLAKNLQVNALGDFHSSTPGGVPGKDSVFCSKAPTYKSYQLASYISAKTGSTLITYPKAGVGYPGALEDICNLNGIPAVTSEVLQTHGTLTSSRINKSYSQMTALLTYYGL
jgi:predicted deacylase